MRKKTMADAILAVSALGALASAPFQESSVARPLFSMCPLLPPSAALRTGSA